MLRVCPECLTAPAPDQRPQAQEGRCATCVAFYQQPKPDVW